MPSPSGTPQSAPFSPFVFQTPSTSESSPNFGLNWTPVHTLQSDAGHQFQVPKVPSTPQYQDVASSGALASASSLKRPRPDSLQNIGKDSFQVPVTNPIVGNESERFLSQSFLEQFDETTLQDSFNTSVMQTLKSTPFAQTQTPPPTRDTSTRRKAQELQQFVQQTPSTIASRRMSVAGEAWRQKTEGSMSMEGSPYQFTPLQITPPGRSEVFNMGATTAPVFSHSGLLWDPQSLVQSGQTSFPLLGEDPFVANTFTSGLTMNPTLQIRSSKPPVQTPARLTIPQQQFNDPGRPHSAGPVHLRQNAMLPPSSLSATSSVDPNMLWMSKTVNNLSRARSNTVAGATSLENRQPYQYHLDQMKREKTLEKSRKVIQQPQQPTMQSIVPARNPTVNLATFDKPRIGLRRSMTDSKIRTIPEPLSRPASLCSVDGHDLTEGLTLITVPRTSSPLKRYKAEAFKSSFSQSSQQQRQSVILTVDEKGRARAQVTTVGNTPVDSPIPEDDHDQSDGDAESTLTMKSTTTAARKALDPASVDCNDAHDALRQVVQERQRKKQNQSLQAVAENYPLVRSHSESAGHLGNFEQRKNSTLYPSNISLPSSIPPYPINLDHIENISPNNISPSTISEQELYTPGGFQGLGSTCICNVPGDNGQPMIRWYGRLYSCIQTLLIFFSECCYKWFHMTCVGLHPNHPPHLLPPYVCVACATSSIFNAGGHFQMYPGMI